MRDLRSASPLVHDQDLCATTRPSHSRHRAANFVKILLRVGRRARLSNLTTLLDWRRLMRYQCQKNLHQRLRDALNRRAMHVAMNGEATALVRVSPPKVGDPQCRPTRDSLL